MIYHYVMALEAVEESSAQLMSGDLHALADDLSLRHGSSGKLEISGCQHLVGALHHPGGPGLDLVSHGVLRSDHQHWVGISVLRGYVLVRLHKTA